MSRRRAVVRSIRRISLLTLGVTSLCAVLTVTGKAEPPEVAPAPRSMYSTPLPEPVKPAPPGNPVDKYKIDKDRFALAGVEDDAPLRGQLENIQEFDAYNEVIIHANQFTAAELEKNASRDVMFLDLVKPHRLDFQYKLLWFEVRLERLRHMEPTKPLKQAGINDLYEAWVFPRNGADPMCIILTELPAGIQPSLKYDRPIPVTVAGYSFKLIRYEAEALDPKDPKQEKHIVRKAPLLIAKSVTAEPEVVDDSRIRWREGFLTGILAIVGGITVVALGLTWWFRRGDKSARHQLETRRGSNPFQVSPITQDNQPD